MPPDPTPPDPDKRDAYAALRLRDFRLFLSGHLIATLGVQMQTVAVGWQLYERTGSAFALGLVGLIQIVPILGLALPAGHVADRFDRRKVLMLGLALFALAAFGLALVSALGGGVPLIYACLLVAGIARAIQGPARSALMPQLVPRPVFPNAVSWNVSGFELASMAGPALGGVCVALFKGATLVYVINGLAELTFLALLAAIPSRHTSAPGGGTNLHTLLAGLNYVRRHQLLLAALTLDLFAVLLGGAVALLPIYAKDILRVGPVGLGWLQAAPSLGAVGMALALAHLPPLRRAGQTLLWAVAGFGAATVVFGLSRSFWLSLLMLFLTGALDNISVVVRHTLVQILTPDEMRGRVSAVNGMFISASNELGRFESGSVAALFGPVFAVVSGGIGTLVVVGAAALRWPALRAYGPLHGGSEEAQKVKP